MLTKHEAARRLDIHVSTLVTWAKCGLVVRHAFNAHAFLYELPDRCLPVKHSSRWDRLGDREAAVKNAASSKP